jgi:hypothetical protein
MHNLFLLEEMELCQRTLYITVRAGHPADILSEIQLPAIEASSSFPTIFTHQLVVIFTSHQYLTRLNMPNSEAHSDEELQHSEALQGIGSWSEPQSMPSDRDQDNNIDESAMRGCNKNSKEIRNKRPTKYGIPEIDSAPQMPVRITTQRHDNVAETRYQKCIPSVTCSKADASNISHKTSNLKKWLCEPAHQQPWASVSRTIFNEGKDKELRSHL